MGYEHEAAQSQQNGTADTEGEHGPARAEHLDGTGGGAGARSAGEPKRRGEGKRVNFGGSP